MVGLSTVLVPGVSLCDPGRLFEVVNAPDLLIGSINAGSRGVVGPEMVARGRSRFFHLMVCVNVGFIDLSAVLIKWRMRFSHPRKMS